MLIRPICLLATGLLLASISQPCQSRDSRVDRSISHALRDPIWRDGAGGGIDFRFGKLAQPNDIVAGKVLTASNYARPYVIKHGKNIPRDDGPTCDEALRNVLADVADMARKVGGNAVVNIVSKFGDVALDNKTLFTCNAGNGSATVDIEFQISHLKSEQLASKAATIETPGLAKMPNALAERIFPPATGYAALEDDQAIPFIGNGCREFYRDKFLKGAIPRAIAISPNGYCHSGFGFVGPDSDKAKDPATRALAGCNEKSGVACSLYAVDFNVVFKMGGLEMNALRPVPVK
jgi:hypothetical protein